MASSAELHRQFTPLSAASPIGIGTYLGDCSDEEDRLYEAAIAEALQRGVSVIDTAINYRCQRSERVVGHVLGKTPTAAVTVCTKGGYIPLEPTPAKTKAEYRDYLEREYFGSHIIDERDLVAGGHCIAPGYLLNQIDRSLANLQGRTIDLYYLHNPEQQLDTVPRDDFERRLRHAFVALESAVADGKIRSYGCATWNGLRAPADAGNHLNLESLVKVAREVGGEQHHFVAVQLPINLAMPEAIRLRNQTVNGTSCTLLEAAMELGISVVASAPLMQGQLAQNLPAQVRDALPPAGTDAQRAIAFVRQLPGVTTVLIGMRNVKHLDEALQLFS